ncbi:MAG: hypothetical protein NC120_12335 [Ruminococcus sp.]|nr:hypothetical protein [Ruminococcus sp.]
MIKFFEDYKEMVLNPSMVWLKLHWKGYIIYVLICGLCGGIAGYIIDEFRAKKNKRKNKSEE